MLTWYFCIAQILDIIHLLTSNWAAQKQRLSRPHTFSSILPICINTHGQYTTPTCPKFAFKISQIFLWVFEFALAEFCAKFVKLNVPWIHVFPLLLYPKQWPIQDFLPKFLIFFFNIYNGVGVTSYYMTDFGGDKKPFSNAKKQYTQ